jgi:hypothetical protein
MRSRPATTRARSADDRGRSVVCCAGVDAGKDQTYFLWGVPAEVLPYLRFPVGELTKAEVREQARGSVCRRRTSRSRRRSASCRPATTRSSWPRAWAGARRAAAGRDGHERRRGVGEHGGYARYTVGQRKGLGGGRGRALYVLGVRPATNEVVVGEHDELFRDEVAIRDLNWLAAAPEPGERLRIQLRHRARAVAGDVLRVDDGRSSSSWAATPQRAVTPGPVRRGLPRRRAHRRRPHPEAPKPSRRTLPDPSGAYHFLRLLQHLEQLAPARPRAIRRSASASLSPPGDDARADVRLREAVEDDVRVVRETVPPPDG